MKERLASLLPTEFPRWAKICAGIEVLLLAAAFALPLVTRVVPVDALVGAGGGAGDGSPIVWESKGIRPLGAGDTLAMERAIRFDLNEAFPEDLDRINGIGEKTAQAIYEYRQANGPYRSFEDLANVPGLRASAIRAMLPYVKIGDLLGQASPLSTHKKGSVVVNVNAASVEELELIPGVGASTAEAIAAARPFSSLQALESSRIRGLGPATVAKMAPYVSFSGPSLTPISGGAAEGEKIELNTASVEQLDALPGMGTTMAEAVVTYRNEHGPFQRIEDLKKIKRFGQSRIDKIRDYVTINGQAP